jgi:Flp pilus assembly protein TadD
LVVCLALTALTAAAYHRFPALGFVYDDRAYLLESAPMLAGLSADTLRWAAGSFHHSNWQPLAVVSTLLDVRLFGLAPAAHHGVNLLLHAGNVVLLFLLLGRMTGGLWRPALVAALFALHPLNVETVAWVTERSNLLCLFFGLLTLLAYRRHAAAPRRARLALVVGLYALALLAKPMLVTLPLLLLLLDFWPLGRMGSPPQIVPSLWRLLPEKIPFLLLAAADAAATYAAQLADAAVQPLRTFPPGSRLANAVTAAAGYLDKALFPVDLAVFYPHRGAGIPAGETLAALGLLAALSAVALVGWRRRPYLAAGWLWYLAALLPVIGVIQVGRQAMADRYAYVSLLGIFVAVAWALGDLVRGRRTRLRLAGAGAGLALCALGAATASQVGLWRDEVSLFGHAIAVTADNDVAQNNLGAALLERGQGAEAIARFREALRIRPDYADAHAGLGGALAAAGETEEGIRHLRESLRLQPDSGEFRVNLGAVLARAGRAAEAETLYREALSLRPGLHLAHMNLANLLADSGRVAEALEHYAEAARLNPNDADVRFNLGVTLAQGGRFAEAAAAFREALRIRPGYEDARRNLEAVEARRR